MPVRGRKSKDKESPCPSRTTLPASISPRLSVNAPADRALQKPRPHRPLPDGSLAGHGCFPAGVPPAGRRKSGKQAKRPMFSVISYPSGAAGKPHLRKPRDASPEGPAPLPGVRHPAAPLRREGGRGEKDKLDTRGQKWAGGEAGGVRFCREPLFSSCRGACLGSAGIFP